MSKIKILPLILKLKKGTHEGKRRIHKFRSNEVEINFEDMMINVKDYEDSLNAVVYRQSPEPSEIPVGLGEDVSLYMTVNPERIPSR